MVIFLIALLCIRNALPGSEPEGPPADQGFSEASSARLPDSGSRRRLTTLLTEGLGLGVYGGCRMTGQGEQSWNAYFLDSCCGRRC